MKKRRLFFSFALFVVTTMLVAWQFASEELNERNVRTEKAVSEVVNQKQ